MRTPREKAMALVGSLHQLGMPLATLRALRQIVAEWRQPQNVADKRQIGAGTWAALSRVCDAATAYQKAIDDARALLSEVVR